MNIFSAKSYFFTKFCKSFLSPKIPAYYSTMCLKCESEDNCIGVATCIYSVQWKLRITDTLGAGPLSVIGRCPYLGGCY